MISLLLQKTSGRLLQMDDSTLFDENTFYNSFTKDLKKCGAELLIESPFITCRRTNDLIPSLERLKRRRVKVSLITRDPFDTDDEISRTDSQKAISKLQKIGVQVVFSEGLHRKLVIIDRKILYEGSLNIMSQSKSQEIMRRIESVSACWQVIGFTKLDLVLN